MKNAAVLWVLAFGCIAAAHAEVRETQDDSFVIESSAVTTASPAKTYAALGKVASW